MNNNAGLMELLAEHAAEKRKLTKGIVLTVIGEFLFCFGAPFVALYLLGLILVIPSIPMLVVGIKSLVAGIKGVIRANRAIKLYKRANIQPEI